jgi:hypothetical protein
MYSCPPCSSRRRSIFTLENTDRPGGDQNATEVRKVGSIGGESRSR